MVKNSTGILGLAACLTLASCTFPRRLTRLRFPVKEQTSFYLFVLLLFFLWKLWTCCAFPCFPEFTYIYADGESCLCTGSDVATTPVEMKGRKASPLPRLAQRHPGPRILTIQSRDAQGQKKQNKQTIIWLLTLSDPPPPNIWSIFAWTNLCCCAWRVYWHTEPCPIPSAESWQGSLQPFGQKVNSGHTHGI